MNSLWGRHVLVLEDEVLLAEELEMMLHMEGAVVTGPLAAIEQLQSVSLDQIDAAVLNIQVRDGVTYSFASELRSRSIPFIFASGQKRGTEPNEWRDGVWVPKPYESWRLIKVLQQAIAKGAMA